MCVLLPAQADVRGDLCRRGRDQPQHALQQRQVLPPSLGTATAGFELPRPKPDVRLMWAVGEAPQGP